MPSTKKTISMWKGIVLEESLLDHAVLWHAQVLKITVLNNGLHPHTILCEKETIEKIQAKLKPNSFAHYWKDQTIIVTFQNKSFEFKANDFETRKQAVSHGTQQGIPPEQLNFPTD